MTWTVTKRARANELRSWWEALLGIGRDDAPQAMTAVDRPEGAERTGRMRQLRQQRTRLGPERNGGRRMRRPRGARCAAWPGDLGRPIELGDFRQPCR